MADEIRVTLKVRSSSNNKVTEYKNAVLIHLDEGVGEHRQEYHKFMVKRDGKIIIDEIYFSPNTDYVYQPSPLFGKPSNSITDTRPLKKAIHEFFKSKK